jgi:hypothetical protein
VLEDDDFTLKRQEWHSLLKEKSTEDQAIFIFNFLKRLHDTQQELSFFNLYGSLFLDSMGLSNI